MLEIHQKELEISELIEDIVNSPEAEPVRRSAYQCVNKVFENSQMALSRELQDKTRQRVAQQIEGEILDQEQLSADSSDILENCEPDVKDFIQVLQKYLAREINLSKEDIYDSLIYPIVAHQIRNGL
jgi:translation initiation factor 2 beta subunit (eIF-2beta)/eIF-5